MPHYELSPDRCGDSSHQWQCGHTQAQWDKHQYQRCTAQRTLDDIVPYSIHMTREALAQEAWRKMMHLKCTTTTISARPITDLRSVFLSSPDDVASYITTQLKKNNKSMLISSYTFKIFPSTSYYSEDQSQLQGLTCVRFCLKLGPWVSDVLPESPQSWQQCVGQWRLLWWQGTLDKS